MSDITEQLAAADEELARQSGTQPASSKPVMPDLVLPFTLLVQGTAFVDVTLVSTYLMCAAHVQDTWAGTLPEPNDCWPVCISAMLTPCAFSTDTLAF